MSFGEPVPDATGELRLQLMQAQDQREAFRALGHRDVLAVIREALATDLSETCDKLRAEITRMEGENHRLRAEVEELRLENQSFKRTVNEASIHYDNRLDEIKRLKAKVERMTKAGIAMGMCLPDTDEANAAYRAFEKAIKP